MFHGVINKMANDYLVDLKTLEIVKKEDSSENNKNLSKDFGGVVGIYDKKCKFSKKIGKEKIGLFAVNLK